MFEAALFPYASPGGVANIKVYLKPRYRARLREVYLCRKGF
jgi:hypothetical protein